MVCSKLINQLEDIKDLQEQLNTEIADFSRSQSEYKRQESISKLLVFFATLKSLKASMAEINFEINPKIKTANYIKLKDRPLQETKIDLDFNAIVSKTRLFYETDGVYVEDEFEEKAKEIWLRNFDAIKNEVATYGYDRVLIIPDKLPSLRVLDAKMTERYAKTSEEILFSNNGSFDNVINSKSRDNIFHILLAHNVQDWENQSLLQATEKKNMLYLSGNSLSKINNIIDSRSDLILSFPKEDVSFGPDKQVTNDTIIAEGFTLAEYLIFQRQFYFETGQHLDKNKWTFLSATTLSNRYIATASYDSVGRRISIGAERMTFRDHAWGCRLCRSFT